MQQFVRGQRAAISQICDNSALQIRIALHSARVPVFDFVCFGVDEREQLSDDRYMVFFNQKSAPENSVTLDHLGDQSATFAVNLAQVPASIARLVFTISVEGAGALRDLQSGVFALHCGNSADAALEYRFSGSDFGNEGALMLAALYRKDGAWRVWAQGQGFVGDLSALLKHFGGEETQENAAPLPQPSVPLSPPAALSTAASNAPSRSTPPLPATAGALQQTLNQASAGSTLTLPRGEHQGPLVIDKPLTLEGNGAVIWAHSGPVVVVQALGVTLRDVEIEATAPDERVPNSNVALWVAPHVGTQLEKVRARGEIIGVAAAEGEWKLPAFLNLGEFAPRTQNSFQIEIETPPQCELRTTVLGVSLLPARLQGGRQNVEIRVQNVAPDILLSGVIELATGGIARTIPFVGRSAAAPREAIQHLTLWRVGDE